ncbi:MAG: esterase family protein [Chloroflexi bacterium]|nr:esterase family protein [Chloroflexota bacterium]MCI0649268.1 esterase family protein [Chloroflexota bacterium]MCI0728852.1 esterase family protein [Chloroflexota bacterium]
MYSTPGNFFLLAILCLAACQSPAQATPAAAGSRPAVGCDEPGRVERGEVADARRGYAYRFQVYRPPCYEAESGRLYPVVYLLPGRGGSPGDWFAAGVGQAADDLILSGEVPPLIIVATETTDLDRYGEAILDELMPYVESHYHVRPERAYRAVAGGSLGGVGAYRLAFGHPQTFASAGLFGSGVVSGEEEQVRAWLAAIPGEQRPRVFLNCGEQDTLMLDRARAMISLLDEAGLPAESVFSPGEHNYAYWVANFPAYLRWLAQSNP